MLSRATESKGRANSTMDFHFRLPRFLVRHQILLAFGMLLAISLGAMLLLAVRLGYIDTQLERLVKVSSPLSAAAFEMEINVIGAGLGVMKYLDDPKPEHRRRVEEDTAEFAESKTQFDRLAENEEKRWLGREIATLHLEFTTLGESLMTRQDELEARLASFVQATVWIDAVLEMELKRSDDFVAAQAESYIGEIGARLGYYLHVHDAIHLVKIEHEARALEALLSKPAAEPTATGWRVAIKPRVAAALRDLRAIVVLAQARQRDIQHFIELRRVLDGLLDEGIQAQVARRVAVDQATAEQTVQRTFVATAVVGLLILVVSGLTAWHFNRRLLDPMRRLAEGVAALTVGNLDHRVMNGHNDEFGDLARGFNGMADSLLGARANLESRVAERTQELAHQAGHDILTGLLNRRGFDQRLDDAMKAAHRRGEKLVLLLLDLDNFKDVNDSLGHDQGDRLLQEVARRLQGQVREVDVVARLGGDEFCVLLTDVEEVSRAGEIAQRCLDALNAPIQLNGATVRARASIGIAIYPDDAGTPVDLLMTADTAMYAAKRAGKHRFAFYETGMTQHVEQQLALEAALREALPRGEFELHYQPQVELESGRMRGVEALIRWRHAERGLVPPDAFISVAERIGLIDAIGVWVLETACRQAVAWQEDGLEAMEVAVNIASVHFQSPGFVDAVARVLRDTGLAPARLEIEVTENSARDPRQHAAICEALQVLGARVSMDDFGTGFSSLIVLRHMPLDTLKLDKQFIDDMLLDAKSSVLIGTLIGMAKGLGFTTVAEGVETLKQVQFLKGLGCLLVQGYFFSKPVPADAIPALARENFLRLITDG